MCTGGWGGGQLELKFTLLKPLTSNKPKPLPQVFSAIKQGEDGSVLIKLGSKCS